MSVILHLGDCLTVMQDIPSQSVDMILCDPPYGITVIKWDKPIPLKRVRKPYKARIFHARKETD